MQVGLTNSGSLAHSDSSSPSATVKVESAFSGGTWARAAAGTSRAAASKGRHGHDFMAVGDSGEGAKSGGNDGELQYRGALRSMPAPLRRLPPRLGAPKPGEHSAGVGGS